MLKGKQEATEKFSIAEWAQEEGCRAGDARCRTCAHDEVRRGVESVIAIRRRGVNTCSKQRLWEKLRELYPDYRMSFDAFKDHVTRCVPGGWSGSRQADGKS